MDTALKVAFDVVVTPLAALLRAFGADPLRLKPSPGPTYWRRRAHPVRLKSRL